MNRILIQKNLIRYSNRSNDDLRLDSLIDPVQKPEKIKLDFNTGVDFCKKGAHLATVNTGVGEVGSTFNNTFSA